MSRQQLPRSRSGLPLSSPHRTPNPHAGVHPPLTHPSPRPVGRRARPARGAAGWDRAPASGCAVRPSAAHHRRQVRPQQREKQKRAPARGPVNPHDPARRCGLCLEGAPAALWRADRVGGGGGGDARLLSLPPALRAHAASLSHHLNLSRPSIITQPPPPARAPPHPARLLLLPGPPLIIATSLLHPQHPPPALRGGPLGVLCRPLLRVWRLLPHPQLARLHGALHAGGQGARTGPEGKDERRRRTTKQREAPRGVVFPPHPIAPHPHPTPLINHQPLSFPVSRSLPLSPHAHDRPSAP